MSLFCCNRETKRIFLYYLSNSKNNFRRLEYGICLNPKCVHPEYFRDYIQYEDGSETIRDYRGKEAVRKYNQWKKRLNNQKQGSSINQSFYYGGFKKSNKKDILGNTIFLRTRCNFNNEEEILEPVKTKIFYG